VHRVFAAYGDAQMTYHLRRLRLHQIIERIAGTDRYRLTDFGLRIALFFTRVYNRLLRPGWGESFPNSPNSPARCGAPSTNSTRRSPHGSNKPNSSHENLTHLHQVFGFKISRPGNGGGPTKRVPGSSRRCNLRTRTPRKPCRPRRGRTPYQVRSPPVLSKFWRLLSAGWATFTPYLQLVNLKELRRVCQLNLPLLGMYSLAYQKVQSSTGSIETLL
jgi:hypothetical protein